jgi:acyl-CoA thioesterase I
MDFLRSTFRYWRMPFLALLFVAMVPWRAAAAEPAARDEEKPRLVVLGDSIAAGHGLEPEEAFPALLQQKVDQEKWPFLVVNAGVSGDTTAGGLRRIEWLLRQRIDVLVLELGGNDGLRGLPPTATRTNLQGTIDRIRARYPDALIVMAGMQMPLNMGDEYRKEFERVFVELSEKNKLPLVPSLLEGVGGRPDLNQADRIHPTAEGQRIIAENVWKVLRPHLVRLVAKRQS